jgi:hypothetical protein
MKINNIYPMSKLYRIYPVSARGEPAYTNDSAIAAAAIIAGSVVHHTEVEWQKTQVEWEIK